MIRAAALAVLLALALTAPAQAGIVSPEDAAELAQTLAEAQEEQDVCYGWSVGNDFAESEDVGSSTGGPGVALAASRSACRRGAVVLEGQIHYACGSCEDSDSARVSISSNLPDPPTVDDLKSLGLKAGALTGDKDDTTLVNMVEALPLLVADRGDAPYVEYEQAKTVPATDHATDKPGSDVLRDTWIQLVLFGGLIMAGPGFWLYKRRQGPPTPQEQERYIPPDQGPPQASQSEPPPASPDASTPSTPASPPWPPPPST